jgi:hypothetical protein
VIARCWSARTTREHAPDYRTHLETQVLPAIRTVDGYAGAMLLERDVSSASPPSSGSIGGPVEIVVITLWRSLDSIREFAGADLERAVVSDDAAALLTEFDRRVRHFDLVIRDDPNRMKTEVRVK